MEGTLHPSLRLYIDCYANPLMTKGWPRGGGLWDQDPILVADFRVIRNYEREWKETQDAIQSAKTGGPGGGLSSALDDFIKAQGESAEL